MAKLVILNQGMTGRTHELNVERTTVGRVEDNTLQLADASVSSHHAEILLRGADIVVKDLGSTNGTFINNDRITETVLKPGQTLRFGQVELKIDDGKPVAPAASGAPAPASAALKKAESSTIVATRGVSLSDLEAGRPAGGFRHQHRLFQEDQQGQPLLSDRRHRGRRAHHRPPHLPAHAGQEWQPPLTPVAV